MKTATIVRPNQFRTRDYALLALIKGATKAGIHLDQRKAASKKACRQNWKARHDR